MTETANMVQFDEQNGVGTITLNRAPANAYTAAFMDAFLNMLDIANSSETNVVIIRSSSEKFFCAGADIKEFAANSTADNKKMVGKANAVAAKISGSDKIFIAEISGHALGGGLELAMACDLRFAAVGDYKMGLPEIKLGLIPGNGGTQRLLRLVGVSKAMELLATGDSFSPDQALNWGLINQLHPKEGLSEAVMAFAAAIADAPPLAVSATKKALNEGAGMSLADGLALEQSLCDDLYDTADAKEGFLAFTEKRPPKFTGK